MLAIWFSWKNEICMQAFANEKSLNCIEMLWCNANFHKRRILQCIFHLNHLVNSNLIWTCNEFYCTIHHICHIHNICVTGEQPLKLAHCLLGYAVGKLILIGLDGQSLGRRHTETNFNKIYFPRKQLKIHYHFLTICLWLDFKIKLQKWNLLYWQQPKAKAKFYNLSII